MIKKHFFNLESGNIVAIEDITSIQVADIGSNGFPTSYLICMSCGTKYLACPYEVEALDPFMKNVN